MASIWFPFYMCHGHLKNIRIPLLLCEVFCKCNWILFIDGFVQLFHIVSNFLNSSKNCPQQVSKSLAIIMNVY